MFCGTFPSEFINKKTKNMENTKVSAVERLKEASNVLVTVSNNPSVDQLAGAIGLTLLLNKLGKHATAVFSGDIPSTLEFLQPEQTLEKNTDSLRDFIISLDKGKADKLRYKVEEKLVRIFITPYHTSIGQDDLEFSLGDFNVDVIVALGVHEQQDLDQAIVAHGRILHDATIISVNTQPNGSLGTISWVSEQSSSLCEMLAEMGVALKDDVFDGQMATALLTGIVAETERFSNQRTTSTTMSMSARLMAAGANQQLVATKLQEGGSIAMPVRGAEPSGNDNPDDNDNDDSPDNPTDGSLRIEHDEPEAPRSEEGADSVLPPIDDQNDVSPIQDTNDETAQDDARLNDGNEQNPNLKGGSSMIMEPPAMGGTLTANSTAPDITEATTVDALNLAPVNSPMMEHQQKIDAQAEPSVEPPQEPVEPESVDEPTVPEPTVIAPTVEPTEPETTTDESSAAEKAEDVTLPEEESAPEDNRTLASIEQSVGSEHIAEQPDMVHEPPVITPQAEVDSARDAVSQAMLGGDSPLEPIIALNAQPVDLNLGHGDSEPVRAVPAAEPAPEADDKADYLDITKVNEQSGLPQDQASSETPMIGQVSGRSIFNADAPPPVPPPMMPPPPPAHMTYGEQPLSNHDEDDNQSQDPLVAL